MFGHMRVQGNPYSPRRIVSVILLLVLIVVICCLFILSESDDSDAVKTSGSCGSDLTWTLDSETQAMVITGNGLLHFNSEKTNFDRAKVKSVSLPEGLEEISPSAFRSFSSLESITIPKNVTKIGQSGGENYAVFEGCVSLREINVAEDNGNYCSENGVLYNKSKTQMIQYPAVKEDTAFTIPPTVSMLYKFTFEDATNLRSIDVLSSAYYSSVDGVLFNKSKTELIRYPAGKEDTSYTIPNGVTTVKEYSFAYADNLRNVVLPASLVKFESWSFKDCKELGAIEFLDQDYDISSLAFSGRYVYFCPATSSYMETSSVFLQNGMLEMHLYYHTDVPMPKVIRIQTDISHNIKTEVEVPWDAYYFELELTFQSNTDAIYAGTFDYMLTNVELPHNLPLKCLHDGRSVHAGIGSFTDGVGNKGSTIYFDCEGPGIYKVTSSDEMEQYYPIIGLTIAVIGTIFAIAYVFAHRKTEEEE